MPCPPAGRGEGNISIDMFGKFLLYKKNRGRPTPAANRCSCGGRFKELLIPFVQNKKILWDLPKPQAIREYVLEELPHFDL
jgi:hypothetical protein